MIENRRLLRSVKKYDNEEKFINHVLSFLRFYQVPKWWTKESLRQYWRDYHESNRGI